MLKLEVLAWLYSKKLLPGCTLSTFEKDTELKPPNKANKWEQLGKSAATRTHSKLRSKPHPQLYYQNTEH